MQLIYNEPKKRYEFLYAKAEMNAGYPLVKANNFQFDGQATPKVWFTQSARRALKLSSYADDSLRERILRDAKDEPDPDACLIEYHAHLPAPRAKAAAGFTWHAPYQLNPFVKGRGWQFADTPDKHWWTTDAEGVRRTCEAVAGFNHEVTDERARVKLHVSESARAAVEAQVQQRRESIVASRATDADVELPCPPEISYLPFQRAGISFALSRPAVLLGDDMGLGKENPVDTPVLTPFGWRTMGELQVGDHVTGSDGSPTEVVGVYPQGLKQIVRVHFNDDTSAECGWDHLWAVRDDNGYRRNWKWRVVDTRWLAKQKRARWEIPLMGPAEFYVCCPHDNLPVPPYLMGVLLADGSLTSGGITFCPGDEEVPKAVAFCLPATYQVNRGKDYGTSTRYSVVMTEKRATHPYVDALKEMGLYGLTGEWKFIPPQYLTATIEQRWALLAGLLDCDGSFSNGRTRFASTSRQLAQDVMNLVRSLGGMARASVIPGRERERAGKKVKELDCWQVVIRLNENPFIAHAAKWRPRRNRLRRTVVAVTPSRVAEAVCVKVSAPDQLYVINDYIVTHNTVQAIGVVNADPEARKVLIVVPASLKVNWRREIEKWCMRAPNILTLSGSPTSGRENLIQTLFDVVRRGPQVEPDVQIDIAIINFDILHKWEAALLAHGWDLLVIDEAHKCKGGKRTKRGAAALRLSKVARRKLLLTGTPIPNRVSELLPLLEMLGAVDQFGGGWGFLQRYCDAHNNGFGWQFDGAAHLDELNDRLRSTVMIRRLKTEVLKELPRKRRQVIELPAVTREQKHLLERERTAESRKRDLRQELRARVELAKASEDPDEHRRAVGALRDGMKAAFDEMSRLRHETAVAKLPQAIEHIEDMLEGTQKVVLGAHHRDVLEALQAHFNEKTPQAVLLYGGMAQDAKQASVDRFQADPTCRLFVGSIQAAGVGLTLTAASTVILVELDWVPANVSQFEDRVLRIGQEADSVLVQHLVLEGSLDARMARTLIQKQEIADRALDRETGAVGDGAELPEDFEEEGELALPEKREAGYAPEEIVRVRYEPSAYEERAATHGVTQAQIGLEALKMTPEKIKLVHRAVRELAGWCDGAVTRDGTGYNSVDTKIGHNLAARPTLTPKAAALAKFVVFKYKDSQLGGRYNELFS